ncbi:MAG: D-glycero-alpha-D-manno-heptose 1-phosphate guanylyltransferase [Saprospiraceae bacterium]|jgi:D-glycero-alpha-D-manno-heptose 1-phosphate guanylyltransferase|tara:strand:- start:217 stop:918 length:702 start_codon:yes stop_codon:yes gene_type:complete
MKLNEAIILAGGMGTRLKSVVKEVPKPMAPINGRPFLEYLLDHLVKNGIERVIFSVGFKSNIIADHFGDKYQNCELIYVYEDEPLGTGGAIKKAMRFVSGENVLVTNGDSIFITDIQGQFVFHLNREADVTLGLKSMVDFDRYGTVIIDNNSIIHDFREKESVSKGLINGGVYIFNVEAFTSIDFPQKFSVENNYFQTHTNQSKFYGYQSDGYFLDIGIPEDFAKAQEEFLRF